MSFPRRPPMPQGNQVQARYDDAYEAWLNAHIAFWKSEECVVLPKVAVGAMRTVGRWRRGARAVDTRLPVGTPVATFLDRDGRPAERWDGGKGLGIAGNQTTHSGVLAGYLLDACGGVLGLKLWEMYPNCGLRARRRIYLLDDDRFGSGNARNYHVICEPDGRPLGGRDNPWFEAWAAQHSKRARAPWPKPSPESQISIWPNMPAAAHTQVSGPPSNRDPMTPRPA